MIPHPQTAAAPPVTPVRHDGLRGLPGRIVRGHQDDPGWARPALPALLAVTAVLLLWDLSASGYANQFYSAAVQAGSESWKAFFFGSSDAANSITVDKPPAALWPMALSVRLFGLSSWAVLVPEALMGVATVGVLYAAVRRRFGAGAGLLAGAVLALTPVAALMFRFNNPDALLCLLMTCAIACVLRALEDGRTRWLLLAGLCFGFGFLTKTLQAWLILPPLAAVYLCCGPVAVRRRIGQVLLAGLAIVLSGGWWVAAVELWPASSRPYIGGSQTNSFLELTFGYNGFGRITGNETGSVGGGGGRRGGGGWGETGITRLFSSDMGGQISWLLPAALILLAAAVLVLWRARRATAAQEAAQRAEFLAWGGALLMTFVTFSFMSGIFHQYYNIALAPYIAALTGMGATLLWRRGGRTASLVLAVAVAATTGWSYVLLERSPDWLPWLRWTVLAVGLVAAVGLLLPARAGRRAAVVAAGLGVATALAGPLAYTLDTVTTAHGGSIITAGPSVQGGGGFPGGRHQGMGGRPGMKGAKGAPGAAQPSGGGQGAGPGFPGGPGGFTGHGRGHRGAGGGMGGLLGGSKVAAKAGELVTKDAGRYTWAAAAIGSQNAASYQLATERPVMAVGGFNGSDPSPTLAQFKKLVADGRIHYFIAGGHGGPGGGRGTASQISSWVEKSFTKVTAGGATFYDLTAPAG
ncbi:ArnT family glycosyltransferase [Streptomyces pinistramenti]|uniref:ArnT family glycosyltransferase n=1 Tax=Streptomyces pinistramenti TaxID=2884812 RepID=UPI001D06C810|nr:glycosyltransferase family 39 protein [Streptomyces pinistramenti]MCB5910819.1 glycosyltransferase family 39 protein [Streptomyces pinistramenti]